MGNWEGLARVEDLPGNPSVKAAAPAIAILTGRLRICGGATTDCQEPLGIPTWPRPEHGGAARMGETPAPLEGGIEHESDGAEKAVQPSKPGGRCFSFGTLI